MRTEHYLFHVLRITPKYMANVCAQWRMSLSPLVSCYGGDFGVVLALCILE